MDFENTTGEIAFIGKIDSFNPVGVLFVNMKYNVCRRVYTLSAYYQCSGLSPLIFENLKRLKKYSSTWKIFKIL